MTSLSYETIFDYFLGNVTDYKLASLDIDTANSMMLEYLKKALGDLYIRRLFSTLSMDDDEQVLTYEMADASDWDDNFVPVLLSKAMVIQWLQPKVKSTALTAQFFGGKEQKWFAQANHLSELRGMLEDVQKEVRDAIRDRGFITNSYLEES